MAKGRLDTISRNRFVCLFVYVCCVLCVCVCVCLLWKKEEKCKMCVCMCVFKEKKKILIFIFISQSILHNQTILNAREVKFPAEPKQKVSDEAKVRRRKLYVYMCVCLYVFVCLCLLWCMRERHQLIKFNFLLPQSFIKACLTYDAVQRPDVLKLCQHPYLQPAKKT